MAKAKKFTNIMEEDIEAWLRESEYTEDSAIFYLSEKITSLCEKYDIVLMIDEMDRCSDNQVFSNFLGMLREKYVARNIYY